MTKITMKDTRCIRCGEESQQMIIHSINFTLGDPESNDRLVSSRQKCPHCGYEANNISIADEIISYDEKVKIVNNICEQFDIKDYELESSRDAENFFDYFWIKDYRGFSIIVGDDGGYLLCPSAYSYEYHKEKYIQGNRSN